MLPRQRLEELTERDIQDLVANQVRESRTLDYKRDWPGTSEARAKIAEDVCAFANTLGGDLVFGVDDGKSGVASRLAPIRVGNLDQAMQELTNSLRDSLEPRISARTQVQAVGLSDGGYVVVLRVPASPGAPHRVTKNNQFYARTSIGKEPMDIHAIRNAFAASTSLAQQVTQFRNDALMQIVRGAGPVPALYRPACVVHVVPVSAITRPIVFDVDTLRRAADKLRPASPGGLALDPVRVNFEGAICLTPPNTDGQYAGYGQVYRDGCIELTDATSLQERPAADELEERFVMVPSAYEIPLVRFGFQSIVAALAELELSGPAYLMVSWVVVAGTRVEVEIHRQTHRVALPRHLTEIVTPPIYLEDLSVQPLAILQPAFDVLWNAVGIAHTQTRF
ncbi:AlbA family DNA-binding domain-containing protein [Burkholderia gladioli]|uniref:AlbA family DNA-binding domain-containing protein n=1 Tax=Burkholderia gladioli TaxID=28095 RepID=UPI00163FA0B5|nr:ATP-binding protein [Burkholderia gladioli]